MVDILKDYFNNESLSEIDGRTVAAAFRRFDIIERYLKTKQEKGELRIENHAKVTPGGHLHYDRRDRVL